MGQQGRRSCSRCREHNAKTALAGTRIQDLGSSIQGKNLGILAVNQQTSYGFSDSRLATGILVGRQLWRIMGIDG